MNPYRSSEWKVFRNQVICLDDSRCVRCGRGEPDRIVFHVHHQTYLPGKLPWQYPFELCETLCAGCHAEHHGKVPPKSGWDVIGFDDLEDLIGSCELCGTDIRYVFLITHTNWSPLEVGEICCDHLTCTDIASNHMESVRRYNDRRKRFASSKRWVDVAAGHHFILQQGIVVELRTSRGFPELRMNGKKGKLSYPTPLHARMKAFDIIESGDHLEFVRKLRLQRPQLTQILRAP